MTKEPQDPIPRKTYKGGRHITPRRKLSVSDERMERHLKAAAKLGITTWAEFANRALDQFCDNTLGEGGENKSIKKSIKKSI